MSGVLGVFGTEGTPSEAVLHAMLDGMAGRGRDRRGIFRESGAGVGVCRHEWELDGEFSGPCMLAQDKTCVVAADATLFRKDDLRRSLGDHGHDVGEAPADLILAAYRAWGERCTEHLRGDFSFVLWDRVGRRALAARDFFGWRPLFVAELGGALLLSSSASALLAHPRCPSTLDYEALGAMATGLLWALEWSTAYSAIRVLPPGTVLEWRGGEGSHAYRYFDPMQSAREGAHTLEEAAEELREALVEATRVRLARNDPTTVWMSGGLDSTSVFAAGQAGLRDTRDSQRLVPISVSYPEGDSGREDASIQAVAETWGQTVHWVDSRRMPIFDDLPARASRAEEPPLHLYELWSRTLARETRAEGSRVAFGGSGGDLLFRASDAYLNDLLRHGRVRELTQELREKRGSGIGHLVRNALLPNPGMWVGVVMGALRGGPPLRHYLEGPAPAWVEPSFLHRSEVLERSGRALKRRAGEDLSDAERRILLMAPAASRSAAYVTQAVLEEGVELRSPLMDRRIVELALDYPRPFRSAGGETKRILRKAMEGLLPPGVLARGGRTGGTTADLVGRSARQHYPFLLERLFSTRVVLADMGIVNEKALREVTARIWREPLSVQASFFALFRTEFWLRERLRVDRAGVERLGRRSMERSPARAGAAAGRAADCAGQTPVT